MKPKPTLRFFLLVVGNTLLTLSLSQAATFYWDNNNTTLGFGNAGGNWAQNSTSGGTSARWKTDPYGLVAGSATQTTANSDIFHFGTSTLGLGSGTITVNAAGVTMGDTFYGAASGNVVLSGGTITFGAAKTITVNNTTNTINSILAGAATSLTKTGGGTLVLSQANTYTGSTIISAGTLDLGGGTANGSLASTVLTLGGGTLSYTRTGNTAQGFTTTNINGGGASGLSAVSGNSLDLGTVNRGAGGYIDFSNVGAGTVAALAASNDSTGIMAGLTFGDTWAVANGAGVAISGLANGSYTQSSSALDAAGSYTGLNIDVDSSQTPDAAITANSLRFSEADANTLTLQGSNVITSGGILIGSGVGANLSTITGGTVAGAASKDLSIIQNNTSGGLTISSVIANNGGSTALTKSGAGLLTLDNSNTFTGGVFANGGRLTLANAGALNSTVGSENAVTVGSGGTLTLNGNSVVIRSLSSNTITPGTAIVENASGTDVTLTIGNSANASSSFAGVIQNGAGIGKLALTKVGSGTLTLSGASTYSGDTTIAAGVVNIGNAASFGASKVLITGGSRINVVGGLTYANDINVGAALQLQNPQVAASSPTSASAATYSGQLTGSGSITLVGGTGNGIFAEHAFTNTNNTFTGNVILPSGNIVGHDIFSFNSIGDNGVFTLQKTGNQNTIAYTGSTNIEFNTRAISLGTISGMMDGGGVTPVNRFSNNGAGTVTFNTDLVATGGGTSTAGTYLFFGGTNTGNNTFAGVIPNTTSGNNLGIGKSDAGKWILTRDNTFLGNIKISGGTLSVPKIDLVANAQPLGQGTIIEIGHQNTAGTLEFTGTTDSSTDKQIQMGNVNTNAGNAGGAIIRNNGSGSLTFSNATFNQAAATVTATRMLTLGGTNTGDNTISGVIQDNVASTGKVALTKSDTGTWVLGGANTFSGNTSLSNNGGKLRLNYSTQDNSKLSDTGTLTLGSGTTLELNGGSHTEIVASTTISSSSALPAFVTQTGGGSSILQMGTITRSAGAYIVFGGSGIATTDTLNNSLLGILGTWATVNNGNDWAVNSTNAANGPITAPVYTDVPRLNGASQVIADNGASQVRIIEGTGSAADITLAAATTSVATITQSNTGGTSVSVIDPAGQTLAVGAILAQNGAGSLTIGNGTNNGSVQALSAAGDLTVNTVGGSTVTINSTIADNSTSTLTKMGTGTLVLSGTNTYAGGTTILNNGGTLRITNPAALGTGPVTIGTSGTFTGTLELALTGTNSIANTFNDFSSANGLTGTPPGVPQILNTSGDNTITSNLTIATTGGNGLNVASNGGLLTLSGTITHTIASNRTLTLGGSGNGLVSGPITAGPSTFPLTKTGSGTWTLAGANTYVGTTTIAGGTLKFGASNVIPDASAVVIGSAATAGTLDINGFSDQLGNGPATAMLTLGSSSSTVAGLVNQVINSGSPSAVLSVDGGVTSNAGPAGFYNGKALISANIQMGVTSGVTRNFTVFDSLDAPVDMEVTGVVSGTNIVGKEGTGTLFLNNDANTFSAQFILNNGKLQVTKLADAGSTSSIGTGAGSSVVRLGDTQNPTLEYVGTTDSSTNRKIQIGTTSGGGTAATILNNGAGKLTFSEPTGFNNTNVATIARTLILGGSNTLDNTISGAIVNNTGVGGTISITKQDAGKWILGGSNAYTGATAINGGTLVITGATQATSAITFGGGVLGLDIASPVTAASATVDFTGQSVLVTGSPTLSSYTLLTASSITGTPTLASPVPGYTLAVEGNALKLNSTGALTGFAAWQAANGTAGTRDQDHDNDGVDNGTEHFLGGNGNTTGFTPVPSVVKALDGTLSVTWVRHPDYAAATFPGNYGTDFVVETSATLTGPWTPETPLGTNVTLTGNNVKYTFPGGPAYNGKRFARLKVTGP